MLEQFFTLYLKIFFMMVPFFVMSIFLTLSKYQSKAAKKESLFRFFIAVTVSCLIFLLFGKYIFAMFGITLDAFKIGAGTVLFLSALDMIRGNGKVPESETVGDYSIVPLAIPSTVGPGLIGVLMVMGAELKSISDITIVVSSLLCAVTSLVCILLLGNKLQKLLGKQGMAILPKITGLFVSAIAAQIIFSGIKGFLF